MTLERLLEVNNKITALLGRTISIKEHAVKAFRKRIGEYVDSHNKKDEIQAWPLVKVCKLKHDWQVMPCPSQLHIKYKAASASCTISSLVC